MIRNDGKIIHVYTGIEWNIIEQLVARGLYTYKIGPRLDPPVTSDSLVSSMRGAGIPYRRHRGRPSVREVGAQNLLEQQIFGDSKGLEIFTDAGARHAIEAYAAQLGYRAVVTKMPPED